jgi:hypothetical protein
MASTELTVYALRKGLILKKLLNNPERITYGRLREVCARHGTEVYAKVRLADVLPIEGSGSLFLARSLPAILLHGASPAAIIVRATTEFSSPRPFRWKTCSLA